MVSSQRPPPPLPSSSSLSSSSSSSSGVRERAMETLPPLLALTPELRLQIYEALLDDIVNEEPRYPWSPALPHSRLQPYVSLILTSRKIHSEASAHFAKHYAARTTFYFESVGELRSFITAYREHATLAHARFNLRAGSHMLESRSRGTGEFILSQPWADRNWRRLNWFNHDGITFGVVNPGVAPHRCSRHELESQGFRLSRHSTNAKRSILLPQSVDKVEFPLPLPYQETMRLTFWAPRPGWQPGPQRPAQDSLVDLCMGCLELEGCLVDVNFNRPFPSSEG